MMQIITADGCVWFPATAILSVFRSPAGTVLITLDSGGTVAGIEPYGAFVERLNAVLCSAAGLAASLQDEVADRRPAVASLRSA